MPSRGAFVGRWWGVLNREKILKIRNLNLIVGRVGRFCTFNA